MNAEMSRVVLEAAEPEGTIQYDRDGGWYYSPTRTPGTWLYGAPDEAPVFIECPSGPHDCSNKHEFVHELVQYSEAPEGHDCEVDGWCNLTHPITQARQFVQYTIVEAVCEACGVVNNHFTAYCPYPVIASSDPVAAQAGEAFIAALSSRLGEFELIDYPDLS